MIHDRVAFGGAVCCCGAVLFGVVWRGELDRAGRQSLGLAGVAGFGTALFVHPAIGYDNWWHLAPAVGGAVLFALGWWLVRPGDVPPGKEPEITPFASPRGTA
jgi:hypothetical protein